VLAKDHAAPVLYTLLEFPEPRPMRVLNDALTAVIDRNEILRTVYRQDEAGLLRQVVLARVEPHVTVVDLDREPSRFPFAELQNSLQKIFDVSVDGPMRVVAGCLRGQVKFALVAVHKIAADGFSITMLRAEVMRLVAEPDGLAADLQPLTWQPADQAAAEAGPQLRQRTDAAMEYLRAGMATSPHATLPIYTVGGRLDLSNFQTQVVSRRLAGHCRAASRKYRVTPAAVLVGLLGIMVAGWTGHRRGTIDMAVANRMSSQLRSSPGRYAQTVRTFLDLTGDPPFSEIARHGFAAVVASLKHGLHDTGDQVMLDALESARIGARIASAVSFDYLDYLPDSMHFPAAGATSEPALAQMPVDSEFFGLQVEAAPVRDSMMVVLTSPVSLLPPAAALSFVHQLLALADAVSSAADPLLSELVERVDLPAYWRGPDWVSVRGSWISLADTTELLTRHPGVRAARVVATDGDDPVLVAYVTTSDTGPDVGDLDDHMRDLASEFPSVMVPQRYVICATEPADVADQPGWLAQPVLATGESGVIRGPSLPQGPREEALAAAFAACHGGEAPPMSGTYAQAGGRFLAIPALLSRLERCRPAAVAKVTRYDTA